jgi:sugar phosphate isomerase/epimerase
VIDYSHAVSLGYTKNDLDPLVPYAGHVHLRQAAPDQIQARWEDGTIDVAALMTLLKQTNYRGYVTLEYEHDKFWNMDRCDVMTETIKMRDAVRPYLT